jgi:glucokinase
MTMLRLVIDVGGTNVRFARAAESGTLAHVEYFETSRFVSFEQALDVYLASTGGLPGLAGAAIAAAGPVDGDRVQLTNGERWLIDGAEISRRLDGLPLALVNDLQAVAAALPHLSGNDVSLLGSAPLSRSDNRTSLAFNVGTGCGAAIVARAGSRWLTFPSEPGHMSLASTSFLYPELIPSASTIEDVLSGVGVAQLYRRIAAKEGQNAPAALDAAAVFECHARDAIAGMTVAVLSELMGRVAGDIVLATAAWGGVFITGSVATSWARVGDIDAFRRAFELKGAMSERMRTVPSVLIERTDVALFGLAMLDLPTD